MTDEIFDDTTAPLRGDGMRGRIAGLITSPHVSLSDLVGGWRGAAELASPHVLFLITYAATSNGTAAITAATAAALVLGLVRLAYREPIRRVIVGVLVVAISAAIVLGTGDGQDFYLLHLILFGVLGVALLISMVVRRPLLGLIVGPVLGDRTEWRTDPRLLRAYQRCTALPLAVIVFREAVQIPLYLAGSVVALGVTDVLMGLPLVAAIVPVIWRILRRAYTARPRPSASVPSPASTAAPADGNAAIGPAPDSANR
jgi:Protein of unknown function (DUF3159)